MRRAWERELCSFRLVHSVARLTWPNSKTWGEHGEVAGDGSLPQSRHNPPRHPGTPRDVTQVAQPHEVPRPPL